MRSPNTHNDCPTVRVRIDDAPQDVIGSLVVGTHFILHKDSNSVYRVKNHDVGNMTATELGTGSTHTFLRTARCIPVRVVSADIVVEIL